MHHGFGVKLLTRSTAPAALAVACPVTEDDDMTAANRTTRFIRPACTLAAVILVTMPAACVGTRGASPSGERSMIIFSNESFVEATLYATIGNGGGYRMGTVMAGRTDTLAVPLSMESRGNVVFYADLLARAESPRTPAVSLRPGEWLMVRLPSSLGALQVLPAP